MKIAAAKERFMKAFMYSKKKPEKPSMIKCIIA